MNAANTAQSNGYNVTSQATGDETEYAKIIALRDSVYAGSHPRLKLPVHTASKQEQCLPAAPPIVSKTSISNGETSNYSASNSAVPAVTPLSGPVHSAPQHGALPSSFVNPARTPTSGPTSSGLDPIFLTKSDVLVRAEIQQKRQRIERILEEQVHSKRQPPKHPILSHDAIPTFDVSEVLRKAQDLVKPFNSAEKIAANGSVSSSDSFDEDTFYSSQMNETTTEEVDEYPSRRRRSRPCRHFVEGKCLRGDACTFSHDPAFRPRVEERGLNTKDVDSVHADSRDSLRPQVPRRRTPMDDDSKGRPTLRKVDGPRFSDKVVNNVETRRRSSAARGPHVRQRRVDVSEEPPYSPPEAGEVQSDNERVGRSTQHSDNRQKGFASSQPFENRQNEPREYLRPFDSPASPIVNHVRVVRNHITSPLAPQPARVSPLAVAKVPHIAQPQGNVSGSHVVGDRQQYRVNRQKSPDVALEPLSSRKRRREVDVDEGSRNVTARIAAVSPEVYIKEEPTSPPILLDELNSRQPRRRPRREQNLFVDTTSPSYVDHPVYETRRVVPSTSSHVINESGLQSPGIRRIYTQGQQPHTFDEPELRRVVSERQTRLLASPRSHSVLYLESQPQPARAASQVYIPQTAAIHPHRASVQPQSASYQVSGRPISPTVRQYSPIRHEAVAMAPPPRRIVMDQYGNQYYEAPMQTDRQVSLVPTTRQMELEPRYEDVPPRRTSFREPRYMELREEPRYVREIASPGAVSPQYVRNYPPAPPPARSKNRVIEQAHRHEFHVPHNNNVRVIERIESQMMPQQDLPAEGIGRVQSVRPISRQYEIPRERAVRVQSVRPDQERIVYLGSRRETTVPSSHPISDRDSYEVLPGYVAVDRPPYRYTSVSHGQRYSEIDGQEAAIYETPSTGLRRPLQRL